MNDTEKITEVLMKHTPRWGVMASPTHWAYQKGPDGKALWFASCNSDPRVDEVGCGWDSKPNIYPDRATAQRAAMEHLAERLSKVLDEKAA